MKVGLFRAVGLCLLIAMSAAFAFGQTSGSIVGTVVDSNGAVVPNATVVVKADTGQEFNVETNESGVFRVAALGAGTYTITITAPNFKRSIVENVKVDVGTPASVSVALQPGNISESVTVTGGAELLQTQTATVGTTLIGRQILDIPTASRDAMDLVLTMPGTATPGRPRTSTVNGLPKGALNITIDGVNVQDNLLKSSDGFFTYIRPRTDAIDEVTLSTSNPGAESSAEGAVQIKFTTKGGTNEYHGGAYWYHRNPALNANYWFFNRDNPDSNGDGKADQQRILLNQPGFKVGGPISIPWLFSGKDRAFFFVNYEEFRFPATQPRTRTILQTTAQNGIFRYGAGGATTVNLYTIAGAATFDCDPINAGTQPCPNTPDPTVGSLLGAIRSSIASNPIRPSSATEFNRELVDIINPAGQDRYFPTVRFDFNVTKDHHFENIWNYQLFKSQTDNLNGVDPAFPNFPNFGSQDSIRFSNVGAWRWNISPTVVNEARLGLTGGTVLFFSQVNAGQFTNQGGYNLGISAAGISNATVVNSPQRRNSPVWQFNDNLTWVKGNHSLNFGGSYTRINLFSQFTSQVVPNVSFALATADPILTGNAGTGLFNTTSMPGSTASERATAAAIYATLIGRVSAVSAGAFPDEEGNFTTLGTQIQRGRQEEFGIFAQDTWRIRNNINLTFGLRWEVQKAPVAMNNGFAQTTFPELYGVSGDGNLFKPGTLTGAQTVFTACDVGCTAYDTSYKDFAPSIGVTWSPNFKGNLMKRVFGNAGQTVFRGGFSRAFVREGLNTMLSILGSNPGGGAGVDASRSVTLGTLPIGTLLRTAPLAPLNVTGTVTYPRTGQINQSANAFDPNLRTGYADSYTVGIQRELTSNMVFEARYVGTRGNKLWRQYNINETNTIENGFAAEFALAQQNLLANLAAGRGSQFRYQGPGTGTSPLPIILANFNGVNPAGAGGCVDPATCNALYSSTFFANTTFLNALNPLGPNMIGFAGTIGNSAANNALFRPNRNAAGLPANFFVVNPDLLGGAWIVDNSSKSWYDGATFELRRRMSKGLLFQASYTFSKSMTNAFASSSVVAAGWATLRDRDRSKVISPFDITHAFKTNFIWELPFGNGRSFLHDIPGWANKIVGGWGVNGAVRVQSGTPFSFGHVNLIGMTRSELQKELKVRYDPTGAKFVFFLPQDIIDNTRRAFQYGISGGAITYIAPTGLTGNTAPTGRFIAPATYGNCVERTTGDCGFTNLVLYGPMFTRFDLSLVKKVNITETVNVELRGEFLNAFNNVNFRIGSAGNDLTTIQPAMINANSGFGITGAAYQDLSTTNDPGARMVQLVVRINF